MRFGDAWTATRERLTAPWQLALLCSRTATWRSIADAAEMVALQYHGGLTVTTPAEGQDEASAEAPVALRSLIQLDGDVVLMIDRGLLGSQQGHALEQALARHRRDISAALAPMRQGLDVGRTLVRLAGRSRWSVLGLGGLCQSGALASAAGISATSVPAWLLAAIGHLELVLLQSLSLILFVLVGGLRRALRWWIRRRIGKRLPGLMERLEGEELRAARAAT